MKNKNSENKDPVCTIDTENGIIGISRKDLEELKNSPDIKAIDELYERLRNGTATQDEQIDFEISLAEREMEHGLYKL
jgi:hypothetical protein